VSVKEHAVGGGEVAETAAPVGRTTAVLPIRKAKPAAHGSKYVRATYKAFDHETLCPTGAVVAYGPGQPCIVSAAQVNTEWMNYTLDHLVDRQEWRGVVIYQPGQVDYQNPQVYNKTRDHHVPYPQNPDVQYFPWIWVVKARLDPLVPLFEKICKRCGEEGAIINTGRWDWRAVTLLQELLEAAELLDDGIVFLEDSPEKNYTELLGAVGSFHASATDDDDGIVVRSGREQSAYTGA